MRMHEARAWPRRSMTARGVGNAAAATDAGGRIRMDGRAHSTRDGPRDLGCAVVPVMRSNRMRPFALRRPSRRTTRAAHRLLVRARLARESVRRRRQSRLRPYPLGVRTHPAGGLCLDTPRPLRGFRDSGSLTCRPLPRVGGERTSGDAAEHASASKQKKRASTRTREHESRTASICFTWRWPCFFFCLGFWGYVISLFFFFRCFVSAGRCVLQSFWRRACGRAQRGKGGHAATARGPQSPTPLPCPHPHPRPPHLEINLKKMLMDTSSSQQPRQPGRLLLARDDGDGTREGKGRGSARTRLARRTSPSADERPPWHRCAAFRALPPPQPPKPLPGPCPPPSPPPPRCCSCSCPCSSSLRTRSTPTPPPPRPHPHPRVLAWLRTAHD